MVQTLTRPTLGHRWMYPVTLGLLVFASTLWAAEPATPVASPTRPRIHYKSRKRSSHRYRPTSVQMTPSKAAPVPMTPPEVAHTARETLGDRKGGGTPTSASLESVRRQVEVQPAGAETWAKAGQKTVLKTSDRIRTGRQSVARIRLQDGTKILLLQNSQAEIENLSSLEKTIKLVRGRVRAIVTKLKGDNHFAIKTPIGVASVRGTEFEVGFNEDSKDMDVAVHDGQVGVNRLGDLANEVILNPGDAIKFGAEGDMGQPTQTGNLPPEIEIRQEAYDTKVKDSIVAMAAEELKNADYQTGKSLIDVDGNRVRVEEYITRPASNQFKLVALNEREKHFDYMTYLGTFNTDLPDDLSIALKQVGGTLNVQPDYYLTDYQLTLSNTIDGIHDSASGGHLVEISFDGTNYVLTDPSDPSNTRTIAAATQQPNGTYTIYNPLKDAYVESVSAADKDDAIKMSVIENGAYRDLSSGDSLWKTRFNSGSYDINGVVKTAYDQTTAANVLALDLDATFSAAPIITLSEFPEGDNTLHNRLTLVYQDGSETVYDNYIINDEGDVAPRDAFTGLTTSAGYQNELLNWNYQQKVKSTEMSGEINLVIDPRIGTISGMIQ